MCKSRLPKTGADGVLGQAFAGRGVGEGGGTLAQAQANTATSRNKA
jgi:hypothetical protein